MTRSFSLNDGGPFYELVRRLHMLRASGMVRSWWLALALWLPLVIGTGARAMFGLAPDPTLRDLSVHVRLLVALPLLFYAERLVESACRSAITSLYDGNLCDRAALDRIVERGERLRDAWWPEALLLAAALAGGQLALWQVIGSAGVFHGGELGTWSFPHLWYAMIALPVFQFVLLRWLWRWSIWGYTLARIARQPLGALATHPDKAAGLAPLAFPVTPFAAFVLAISAVVSSAWATQVLSHRVTLPALVPGLLVLMLFVLVIAVGPLLPFCGHLYRARRRALFDYGEFAHDYMRAFHDKWIVRPTTAGESLGSQDIQAFNDLGSAFQVIEKTRWFVFGPRKIVELWLAAVLPMIPLFASAVTVEQVLRRIVSTILGGLPI